MAFCGPVTSQAREGWFFNKLDLNLVLTGLRCSFCIIDCIPASHYCWVHQYQYSGNAHCSRIDDIICKKKVYQAKVARLNSSSDHQSSSPPVLQVGMPCLWYDDGFVSTICISIIFLPYSILLALDGRAWKYGFRPLNLCTSYFLPAWRADSHILLLKNLTENPDWSILHDINPFTKTSDK